MRWIMILVSILIIHVSVYNVRAAPRARSYHTPWCAYLQGLTIPMSRSHTCVHGFIATQCGALCKKGPGEICGGSRHRDIGQYGQCAEGLQCSDCNRCTGCSYTQFRCYSDHDKCVSASDIIL